MPQIQPQLRELLASPRTAKVLSKIAQRYNFSNQQKILQAKIVGLLILGRIKIDELPRRISRHLSLDKKKSQKIAQEIKSQIFNQIHPSRSFVRRKKEKKKEKASLFIKGIQRKNLPQGIKEGFRIDEFIKSLGIKLSSLQFRRLYNVILIYLKDIRDAKQTYLALSRGMESGGVGLGKAEANSVLKKLKAIKNEKDYLVEKKEREVPKERMAILNEARILDQEKRQRKADALEERDSEVGIASGRRTALGAEKVSPQISKEREVTSPHFAKGKEEDDQSSLSFEREKREKEAPLPPQDHRQSKVMTDVKRPQAEGGKIDLNSLDDLAQLNLFSFRKGGRGLQEKMVNFFQEEPFLAKEFFEQSPLYTLYQTMVKDALRKNLSLEGIVEQYRREGRKYLTIEEIEQIAEVLSHSQ